MTTTHPHRPRPGTSEPDHIEIHFQGLAYDPRGLVKTELLFASATPRIDGAE